MNIKALVGSLVLGVVATSSAAMASPYDGRREVAIHDGFRRPVIEHGFEHGFDHRFDRGFDHGFNRGFDRGFNRGFDRGYDRGFDRRFDRGFDRRPVLVGRPGIGRPVVTHPIGRR